MSTRNYILLFFRLSQIFSCVRATRMDQRTLVRQDYQTLPLINNQKEGTVPLTAGKGKCLINTRKQKQALARLGENSLFKSINCYFNCPFNIGKWRLSVNFSMPLISKQQFFHIFPGTDLPNTEHSEANHPGEFGCHLSRGGVQVNIFQAAFCEALKGQCHEIFNPQFFP